MFGRRMVREPRIRSLMMELGRQPSAWTQNLIIKIAKWVGRIACLIFFFKLSKKWSKPLKYIWCKPPKDGSRSCGLFNVCSCFFFRDILPWLTIKVAINRGLCLLAALELGKVCARWMRSGWSGPAGHLLHTEHVGHGVRQQHWRRQWWDCLITWPSN